MHELHLECESFLMEKRISDSKLSKVVLVDCSKFQKVHYKTFWIKFFSFKTLQTVYLQGTLPTVLYAIKVWGSCSILHYYKLSVAFKAYQLTTRQLQHSSAFCLNQKQEEPQKTCKVLSFFPSATIIISHP